MTTTNYFVPMLPTNNTSYCTLNNVAIIVSLHISFISSSLKTSNNEDSMVSG